VGMVVTPYPLFWVGCHIHYYAPRLGHYAPRLGHYAPRLGHYAPRLGRGACGVCGA